MIPNLKLKYSGGKLLFELDRVLRPGGYFVWSATPVYRKDPEDVNIWKGTSSHDPRVFTLSFMASGIDT